jgi:hypothetical protein
VQNPAISEEVFMDVLLTPYTVPILLEPTAEITGQADEVGYLMAHQAWQGISLLPDSTTPYFFDLNYYS